MPVTYRENSSAVKWNLFVYYHPSPLYHYLAGVFNPWQRGVSWRAWLVLCPREMETRDAGSCPPTIHPPPRYLDVYFTFSREMPCHLSSRFDFTISSVKIRRFRELSDNLERFETLPRSNDGYLWPMEYVFMKKLIVSWYPEEREGKRER